MLPRIHILGHTSHTYGLTFLAALIVAIFLVYQRVREKDKPSAWVLEGPLVAMVGGLVGARLYWLCGHPQHFDQFWNFSQGNAWYGGFTLGAVAVLAWMRWRRVPLLLGIDTAAYIVPLVQAIGRIGCQYAGDGDYGIRSHLPWAMAYPHGTSPTPPGVRVQPTPIYETVALGLIAWWLWRHRDTLAPGIAFAAFMLLDGLERFLIEFIRRNPEVLWGLTLAQFESLALALAGGTWLWLAHPRRIPLPRRLARRPRPVSVS